MSFGNQILEIKYSDTNIENFTEPIVVPKTVEASFFIFFQSEESGS